MFSNNQGVLLSLYDMLVQLGLSVVTQGLVARKELEDWITKDGGSISDSDKEIFLRHFDLIRYAFDKLDLGAIGIQYGICDAAIKRGDRFSALDAIRRIEHIIVHELTTAMCFVVPREMAKHLFIESVPGEIQTNLDSCVFDLLEANRCLAFERNTACVFHCMCALELGLPAILRSAKKLGVKHNYDTRTSLSDTWGVILNKLDSEIRKREQQPRPRRKPLQEISELSARMRAVKNAWRDNTIHARGDFNDGVARDILTQTSSFLKYLSSVKTKSK